MSDMQEHKAKRIRLDGDADVVDGSNVELQTYPEQVIKNSETKVDEAAGDAGPQFAFSNNLSLEDVRQQHENFCRERNWGQYHTPRNILLDMVGEVGELAELFQWKEEVEIGLPGWTKEKKGEVEDELSDVLMSLVRLADRCHVDLPTAVVYKMEKNAKKYPIDKAHGSSKKYTEYKEERQEQETKKMKRKDVNTAGARGADRHFAFSNNMSLEDVRQLHDNFCRDRNWGQYHTPRNILIAMVGEVGEVAELFQWKEDVKIGLVGWTEKQKVEVEDELSDVLIYLIRLADRCHVDLPTAFMHKLEKTAQKYPIDKAYGSSTKYTEFNDDQLQL